MWGRLAACAPIGNRRLTNMTRPLWLSLAILLTVAIAAPLIGSSHIELRRALAGASPDHEILFYARLPRVLLPLE